MNEWDKKKHKFAMEICSEGAVINYNHIRPREATISLATLSLWCVMSGLCSSIQLVLRHESTPTDGYATLSNRAIAHMHAMIVTDNLC